MNPKKSKTPWDDYDQAKEDAKILAQIRLDADMIPSFAPELTGDAEEDAEMAFTPDEVEQDVLVRGLFVTVSVVVVDQLFEDLVASYKPNFEAWCTMQVSSLPDRFESDYGTLFIKSFIAATIDVSRRVVDGGEPLATTAEELALHLILDEMEVFADMFHIPLGTSWRANFEDRHFDDLDYLYLMGDEKGDYSGASTNVEEWFEPFNDERKPSPTARRDRRARIHGRLPDSRASL